MEKKAEVPQSPTHHDLIWACVNNEAQVLEKRLKETSVELANMNKGIIAAVSRGHLDVVKLLVKDGRINFSAQVKDADGNSYFLYDYLMTKAHSYWLKPKSGSTGLQITKTLLAEDRFICLQTATQWRDKINQQGPGMRWRLLKDIVEKHLLIEKICLVFTATRDKSSLMYGILEELLPLILAIDIELYKTKDREKAWLQAITDGETLWADALYDYPLFNLNKAFKLVIAAGKEAQQQVILSDKRFLPDGKSLQCAVEEDKLKLVRSLLANNRLTLSLDDLMLFMATMIDNQQMWDIIVKSQRFDTLIGDPSTALKTALTNDNQVMQMALSYYLLSNCITSSGELMPFDAGVDWPGYVIDIFISIKVFDEVKWFLQYEGSERFLKDKLILVAETGQACTKIFKLLLANPNCDPMANNNAALKKVVENNDVVKIMRLINCGRVYPRSLEDKNIFQQAIKLFHKEEENLVSQLLKDHQFAKLEPWLKYQVLQLSENNTRKVIIEAINTGDKEIISYWLNNKTFAVPNQIFLLAAQEGQLEILPLLLKNNHIDLQQTIQFNCDVWKLYDIDLPVTGLKFQVYEDLPPGKQPILSVGQFALLDAILRGHLAIVKYLLETHQLAPSFCSDKQEVVSYMKETFPILDDSCFTDESLCLAIEMERPNIVKYLLTYDSVDPMAGKGMLLKYAAEHLEKAFVLSLLKNPRVHKNRTSAELLQWAKANYAPESLIAIIQELNPTGANQQQLSITTGEKFMVWSPRSQRSDSEDDADNNTAVTNVETGYQSG